MTLAELRKKGLELLSGSDLPGVFSLLARRLKPGSEFFKTLIILNSRHKALFDKEMRGVISHDDATLEHNKIIHSLTEILNGLKLEDMGDGGSLDDPLDELARELPVDIPLSPMHLVNCDRRTPFRNFRRTFGEYLEHNQHFQFYFLPSCPTQEPEGFSERTVYYLLERELENEKQAIDYKEMAGGRLLIEPLPKDSKKFREYFAQRFKLENSDQSFENFLQTGLPKLHWKYVATAFKVTADKWEPDLMEPYFHWLIDTFHDTRPDIPVFLFFIVVIVKNAHQEEKVRRDDREALDSVRAIVEAYPGQATLIEPLLPVHSVDLEYWIDDLGNANTTLKDRIKEQIANQLNEEELAHYRASSEFNMERIAGFQEKVYNQHRQQD